MRLEVFYGAYFGDVPVVHRMKVVRQGLERGVDAQQVVLTRFHDSLDVIGLLLKPSDLLEG